MSPARAPAATLAPSLEGPLEAFLDELRTGRRLSPRTLDAYAHDLRDYAGFAVRRGVADWEGATPTLVDAYFSSLLKRGLASATVARRRSALKGFHAHRAPQRGEAQDPLAGLPPAHGARSSACPAPFVRHAFAGARGGSQSRARAARPRLRGHHRDLHASRPGISARSAPFVPSAPVSGRQGDSNMRSSRTLILGLMMCVFAAPSAGAA